MPIIWLIPLAPLIGALIAGVLALTRKAEKVAPIFTIAATLYSGYIALFLHRGYASATWLTIGSSYRIALDVNLDALTFTMVCVVTLVSALVQMYSIGYMENENGYARYFAYVSIFTASMLGLVSADNLFQLYVCWELVGICSYLLIGFWWFKPSAANAAKKAFVVTRFGDVGFLLGVLLLSSAAGSFQFTDIAHTMHAISMGELFTPLVSARTFLWLAPLLLFCGAVGKSAQFPLHIWLPDAMEGPTPVSALIHAATMVAAGVYMVTRLFTLFAYVPVVTETVLVIGMITAFLSASIAIVQNDIKKVLAYSTISQLGYMMLGLGAMGTVIAPSVSGVYTTGQTAAMFHLTTHAMFKALLFLTAGSVIHALHHSSDPNDMRSMGGLMKRMPITAWTCLAGVLALAGLFPFSGFWSKDAIFGALREASSKEPVAMFALVVAIIVAGMTAFYSLRLWLMTFWGEPRSEHAEHAHESPWVMTLPLVILGFLSVFLGGYLYFGDRFANSLTGLNMPTEPLNPALAGISTLVALFGLGLAWKLYAVRRLEKDPVTSLPSSVYSFLVNLWYMDAFWNRFGAAWVVALGGMVAWFDRNVVDRIVSGLPAWVCQQGGLAIRKTESGQTQSYAVTVLAAVSFIIVTLLWLTKYLPGPMHITMITH